MALQPGGDAADRFDYVIVGSGATGSVLSARLTEDPGKAVCVLAYGPPDRARQCGLPGTAWHVPDAGYIQSTSLTGRLPNRRAGRGSRSCH